MLEKDIEKYFCACVKTAGGLALKFTSPGFAGVPDRIVLMPNAVIAFAELKAPGEKPRKLQEHIHGSLRKLGFKVYTPSTKEQAYLVALELLAESKKRSGALDL